MPDMDRTEVETDEEGTVIEENEDTEDEEEEEEVDATTDDVND